jgi:hypothetical protein
MLADAAKTALGVDTLSESHRLGANGAIVMYAPEGASAAAERPLLRMALYFDYGHTTSWHVVQDGTGRPATVTTLLGAFDRRDDGLTILAHQQGPDACRLAVIQFDATVGQPVSVYRDVEGEWPF